MFKHLVTIACLICLICLCSANLVRADTKQPLLIGVGDQVSIKVYNEPDLTIKVRVDDTGLVNFPLLGEIKVLEYTPKTLASYLEKQLLDGYLVKPHVTVFIETYRPFYIRGEVTKPGAYEYSSDLTATQAIAIAGGLKDRASSSNWMLVREINGKEIQADKDTKIYPGDVLTIKPSLF